MRYFLKRLLLLARFLHPTERLYALALSSSRVVNHRRVSNLKADLTPHFPTWIPDSISSALLLIANPKRRNRHLLRMGQQ